MFKLVFEKGEEPEIKLPTSAGSWKKQESSQKTSISALLTMPKPLTVWITINCGKSERDGNTRPPNLPLEKSVCRPGSNSLNWTWNNRLVPNRKRSTSRLYIVTLLISLLCRVHHENAGLKEAQAGFKIAGRNINNLRYADDTTIMAEIKEELKRLLMKVKEESEKVDLKLTIQKTKIIASDPIT